MSDNPLDLLEMLPGDPAVTRHNYLVYATGAAGTKSVAGSSDVTLTEIEAAHRVITFTGVLTGNVSVKVPQKEKEYAFINATTGAFTLTVIPVTSGTGFIIPRGMLIPAWCNGTTIDRSGTGMAVVPLGGFHTIARDGQSALLYADTYSSATPGSTLVLRHARGTQLAPAYLDLSDFSGAIQGDAWGRNAANSADDWISLARIRPGVASKDAQGRLGGFLDIAISPGVSAPLQVMCRLFQTGTLTLGFVDSSDAVVLSPENINGVNGDFGLKITGETGISTFIGNGVLSRNYVEVNTAVAASPNILTVEESGTTFINTGATARNYHTLPLAVAGVKYRFYCSDADGMRIVANTGDFIRNGATLSTSAGYVESTAIGDWIYLECISISTWAQMGIGGTWTVA